MIVILLLGIGICLLVLMQEKGDTRPPSEGDIMTNARIAQMLHDDEKARRRGRFERGIGPAQHGRRVESRKVPTRNAVKQALRREQW